MVLLVCCTRLAIAQDFSRYQKKTFESAEGSIQYRILYPDNYKPSKKYPLVVFLHGAGERGNDNESQLKHGGALFLKDEVRKKFPAIVVFPQCPAEDFWANLKVEDKTPREWTYDYTGAPKPALGAAMALVNKLIREEAVDANRVYISGLSMGGMGTFEAAYRFPALFAAALPICGGGNDQGYDNRIKSIPYWVFHGDADPVVPVRSSRIMVGKLTAVGASVKYTEYPGVGHDSWTNVFAEPDYLVWMFKQKRK